MPLAAALVAACAALVGGLAQADAQEASAWSAFIPVFLQSFPTLSVAAAAKEAILAVLIRQLFNEEDQALYVQWRQAAERRAHLPPDVRPRADALKNRVHSLWRRLLYKCVATSASRADRAARGFALRLCALLSNARASARFPPLCPLARVRARHAANIAGTLFLDCAR
jgi:hypothetical protein